MGKVNAKKKKRFATFLVGPTRAEEHRLTRLHQQQQDGGLQHQLRAGAPHVSV